MTEPIAHFVGGPVASVAARLADRGVRLVLGTVVDLSGVTRAKGVPLERLAVFVGHGMGASPTWIVSCVDGAIAFTAELGVVGDLRVRIDPSATTVVDHGVAWAPAELFEQDGTRFPGCARWRLRQVCDRVRAAGLTVRTGAELEFVLTHAGAGDDAPAPPGDHRPWPGYGVRQVLEAAPLLVDLTDSFHTAGMPIEQLHAEAGAGQFELSLPPADPLTTADRTVVARILIGRAAARHGMDVSFSPMPYGDGADSGAHLHLSLRDRGGPLLSGGSGPYGITRKGGAAIAGLVDRIGVLQAVLAGSAVSVWRLRPGNWAGAFACWGRENREAAVRLISDSPGAPHGASVEVKAIDGSANPYLAAAAVIGMALDGVQRNLPLPREIGVDPAVLPESERAGLALATDQLAALEALGASRFARELLGDMIVDGTVAVRRYEQRRYGDAPSQQVAAAFRSAFNC